MGFPSVTYTFANSTTADATQVNQDFTDIINGLSDGTKNINVSAGTFAGTLNAQGAVTLGASTANLVTFNGSLTSSIPVGTTNLYDIGSDTFGLASVYLGSGSSAHSTRLKGAAVASAYTFTLPIDGGTSGYLLQTNGSGTTSWVTSKRSPDFAANYALAATVSSNAMTVALKAGAGTDATSSDTIDIIFRNATATTGTPNLVNVIAAMSVVIPSGATLGLVSAQNQYIHVYIIQDTTNELAVSGSRIFDEGSLQNATAITNGSTSNSLLYSTSTHTSRPVRYLGRILSNQTVSGTYAASPTEISLISGMPTKQERSEIVCAGGSGYGSTNTAVRIFTSATTTGTEIVRATSATLGDTFTVQSDGMYTISRCDGASGGANYVGLSKNSSQLTSGVSTITASDRLTSALCAAGIGNCVSVTRILKAGDIIRAHDSPSGTPFSGSADVQFTITKVA